MRAIKDGKLFYARLGDFFGPLSPSPREAIQRLETELIHYKPLNHTYLTCKDGTTLHLHQTPSHGWNYNIIPPKGYKGRGVGVRGTWVEALRKAIEHARQEFGGLVEGQGYERYVDGT